MRKIVLASLSPRRYELLSRLGVPFIVDSENVEEILDPHLPLTKRLEELSYLKALPVFKRHQDAIVIGADTIVCFEEKLLGKPKNRQDAKKMLLSYSGKSQYVYTAVTVLDQNKRISFVSQSEVCFKPLTEDIIEHYLDENEWQDKAGGYAIQGKGASLIDHYQGDYDTIVGLPVQRLKEVLENEFEVSF